MKKALAAHTKMKENGGAHRAAKRSVYFVVFTTLSAERGEMHSGDLIYSEDMNSELLIVHYSNVYHRCSFCARVHVS